MNDSSVFRVPLRGKYGVGLFALVDAEYAELVFKYSWYTSTGHACANIPSLDGKRKGRTLTMHRLLMQEPTGMDVMHMNGDKLDNRMSNLRVVTRSQTAQASCVKASNTSGFRGVSFHKGAGRWQASIKSNGKNYHLGTHDTPEEASAAYQQAALIHHGEYARKAD